MNDDQYCFESLTMNTLLKFVAFTSVALSSHCQLISLSSSVHKNIDVKQKLLGELFREKNTVIILDTSDAYNSVMDDLENLSVIRINSITSIPNRRITSKSIMIDFDLTTGLIYRGDLEIACNQVFPRIGTFNPKMRILLYLTDKFSPENATKLFSIAWNDHRIYDMFILFEQNEIEDLIVYTWETFSGISNQLVTIDFRKSEDDGMKTLNDFEKSHLKNLKGYKLKVVLFKFMMVCEGEEYENGTFNLDNLKYQDSEALKLLSKALNFSIEFVTSPDGVKHGYQTSNFTFTGSLGMVEYENADLSPNARLVAEYNTSNTLCLFPTTATKLKFSVPKKLLNEVNILKSLYNFLDDALKISVLVMFIVLPMILRFFDHIYEPKRNSTVYNYLMLYSIMTFVSIDFPRNWPSRYITGSVVLVWLIIGNTYAGKMIEFLNTNFGLRQIGSIDELTQTNLEIKIPYPMAILFEGEFKDAPESHLFINKVVKTARKLESVGDKMAFIDVENMGEMIRSRKNALLFLDNLTEFVEKSFYDDDGNNYLTHIDETPYEYYYAMSVPKTSPFVKTFNEILMHVFEAGISKYQMALATMSTDSIYIRRVKDGKIPSNNVKSISLSQFNSIFYLLLGGFFLSFLIFVLELIFKMIFCGFSEVFQSCR